MRRLLHDPSQWFAFAISCLCLILLVAVAGCAERRPATPFVLYVYTAPGCYQCEVDKPAIRKLEARGLRVVVQTYGTLGVWMPDIYPFYMLVDERSGRIVVRSPYLSVVTRGIR